jgi:two-component system sensor histidine kinase HydH
MQRRFSLSLQTGLLGALFLISLGVLLYGSFGALTLPRHADEARRLLSEASRQMTEEATPLFQTSGPRLDHRLSEVTAASLANVPGAEGGFYVGGSRNEFTGFAFPNDPHAPPEPLPPPEKKGPHGKKRPPPPPPRREPPPREADLILAQVRECLLLPPGSPPIVQVRDVPPSRVLVVTERIGSGQPALASTWLLLRLSGPEQYEQQARRYLLSSGLALAGFLLALALTANLARSLEQGRRRQEQLREDLRRAEHLATLGRLLAGVAHEVRNPLAAIRSTVQLWQRLPEQARSPTAVDPILQAVDRLNGLVSRLLYFTRSGLDEPRSVDLNAVVRDTLALLAAETKAHAVQIRADLAADLPSIRGSAQTLQQVVLNLASNALQAMPNGGVLRCRTGRSADGSAVELEVADTGPGVPAAARQHLFEPFFTTRPDGTGLGLALCREIVQQHGGRIDLVEEPGWGAVFRVTLPSIQ